MIGGTLKIQCIWKNAIVTTNDCVVYPDDFGILYA